MPRADAKPGSEIACRDECARSKIGTKRTESVRNVSRREPVQLGQKRIVRLEAVFRSNRRDAWGYHGPDDVRCGKVSAGRRAFAPGDFVEHLADVKRHVRRARRSLLIDRVEPDTLTLEGVCRKRDLSSNVAGI